MNITRIIAAAAVLLLLAGCAAPQPVQDTLVNFYYLQNNIDYDAAGTVMAAEVRDTGDQNSDLQSILKLYLQGPGLETLRSPLPKSVTLVDITRTADYLQIEFSSRLSYLTGIELTLACACVARTCLELTDVQEVRICAQDALLDGAKYISITADSLLLTDDSAP